MKLYNINIKRFFLLFLRVWGTVRYEIWTVDFASDGWDWRVPRRTARAGFGGTAVGGRKVFSPYPATAREEGSFDSARFRGALSSLAFLPPPICFVLSAVFRSLEFLSDFVVVADDGGWQIPSPPICSCYPWSNGDDSAARKERLVLSTAQRRWDSPAAEIVAWRTERNRQIVERPPPPMESFGWCRSCQDDSDDELTLAVHVLS